MSHLIGREDSKRIRASRSHRMQRNNGPQNASDGHLQNGHLLTQLRCGRGSRGTRERWRRSGFKFHRTERLRREGRQSLIRVRNGFRQIHRRGPFPPLQSHKWRHGHSRSIALYPPEHVGERYFVQSSVPSRPRSASLGTRTIISDDGEKPFLLLAKCFQSQPGTEIVLCQRSAQERISLSHNRTGQDRAMVTWFVRLLMRQLARRFDASKHKALLGRQGRRTAVAGPTADCLRIVAALLSIFPSSPIPSLCPQSTCHHTSSRSINNSPATITTILSLSSFPRS